MESTEVGVYIGERGKERGRGRLTGRGKVSGAVIIVSSSDHMYFCYFYHIRHEQAEQRLNQTYQNEKTQTNKQKLACNLLIPEENGHPKKLMLKEMIKKKNWTIELFRHMGRFVEGRGRNWNVRHGREGQQHGVGLSAGERSGRGTAAIRRRPLCAPRRVRRGRRDTGFGIWFLDA